MVMAQKLEAYRKPGGTLPAQTERWELYGPGFDNLRQVTVDLPEVKPHELLVRHDACGICFSDIKIINLGGDHPRLRGRNLRNEPVVLGHECIVTVMRVGAELADKYQVGQRLIVQPDVYYRGVNMSYGYALDGGMAEYGVITKEIIDGDEGTYLVPVRESTGYVEAALVEPWACVVAAYEYPNYRTGIMDDGHLLIVDLDGNGVDQLFLERHCHRASLITNISDVDGTDWPELRREVTRDAGFDDIVILGAPSPEQFAKIAGVLAKSGIMDVVTDKPMPKLPVDIGRVHYEFQLYIGASTIDEAGYAYNANTRGDLKAGGIAWFVGAGGPMGQMHVQRAIMVDNAPRKIVVSDLNPERLERLRDRFGDVARSRGIEFVLLGANDDPGAHGPYDDIVSLVPSADLVAQTIPHLAERGVYNIFAGINKGVTAELDLGTIIARKQRLIGTTGSSIEDMRKTLSLVESGKLSTNASLAAIAGLDGLRDGLEAVKEGRFPGKTVIFPTIAGLPLMSLEDMQERLPEVYAKLKDGKFWTREAEEVLYEKFLNG
jgi:threonine dehydrogenase-like Zn-dependent dehydrogenase